MHLCKCLFLRSFFSKLDSKHVYLHTFINSLWHYSLLFLGGCTFFSIYSSEPCVKEYKTGLDEKKKRKLGENLFMISLFLHLLPDINCDCIISTIQLNDERLNQYLRRVSSQTNEYSKFVRSPLWT
uniref:Uncharacterized protein n=1 Tax=Ficedula albicollis TaxID=59894 RepID=A0A803WFG5_FICAL